MTTCSNSKCFSSCDRIVTDQSLKHCHHFHLRAGSNGRSNLLVRTHKILLLCARHKQHSGLYISREPIQNMADHLNATGLAGLHEPALLETQLLAIDVDCNMTAHDTAEGEKERDKLAERNKVRAKLIARESGAEQHRVL